MTDYRITDKSFIKVYDDLIPLEECDKVIDFFNQEEKFQRTISRKEKGDVFSKKSDTASQIDSTCFEKIFSSHYNLETLFINMNQALQIYLNETDILKHLDINDLNWCPQKIQKTLPGGGYHVWHIEKGGDRLDLLSRVLVYTLYLNDVEEGGETEFLIQNMRVKPKKGRICFFPAHFPYLHRGNPPLCGEKFIMTSWFSLNLKV
jgi:hypothetical protein